jgi:hypothetical protein
VTPAWVEALQWEVWAKRLAAAGYVVRWDAIELGGE